MIPALPDHKAPKARRDRPGRKAHRGTLVQPDPTVRRATPDLLAPRAKWVLSDLPVLRGNRATPDLPGRKGTWGQSGRKVHRGNRDCPVKPVPQDRKDYRAKRGPLDRPARTATRPSRCLRFLSSRSRTGSTG